MIFQTKTLCLFLASSSVAAFTFHPQQRVVPSLPQRSTTTTLPTPFSSMIETILFTAAQDDDEARDNEIDRLRSMAAKLRAEAAELEAEQKAKVAAITEEAFNKFDLNQDGQITLDELKQGLEESFSMELKEEKVRQLMTEFDKSGDGALQLDEFVSVERFRTKLDAFVREEKAIAQAAQRKARDEQEKARVAQAKADMFNESEPTTSDKILSVLPYLFPLMDGLQFGRFLIGGSENPLIVILALIYTVYRSIPLGGFIAFLALSIFSNNLRLNRLIRFNMQQAIFLDIALFFPGLLSTIYTLIVKGVNLQVPETVTQVGNDAVFVVLLAAIAYCVGSSLFGVAPNKIPFLSQYVEERMPNVDMFEMDSKTGRMVPKARGGKGGERKSRMVRYKRPEKKEPEKEKDDDKKED